MFEKNEKLELLKSMLSTREDYTETVKNLNLDKKEKEILLLASVHIKKKNIDQELIDQAYDIMVKKSMDMDDGGQSGDAGKVVEEVAAETISNQATFTNRKIQIPKNSRKTNLNYGLIFVIVLMIFLIYKKGFFGGGELQVIDASKLQDRNGIFYTVNGTDPYTGITEKYYSRGKKKEERNYIDGKLNGHVVHWYKNGKKKVEKNYIDGKKNGLMVFWYESGQKKEERTYIDGQRNGLLVEWYESGQKKREMTYIDSQRNGPVFMWYENGQKQSEEHYIDDKRNGLFVAWYENGQKYTEGNYIDHKENGHVVRWYENGQKEKEWNYINGQLIGPVVGWDKDGQRKSPIKSKGKLK